jgi:hypothetical protein
VQAKNVNSNATDSVFLAFTVVQQIMTELLGTATEKDKFHKEYDRIDSIPKEKKTLVVSLKKLGAKTN